MGGTVHRRRCPPRLFFLLGTLVISRGIFVVTVIVLHTWPGVAFPTTPEGFGVRVADLHERILAFF